jgi:hypothetical protein
MPLEQLDRSLMRVRAKDHVGAHLIACIFDAALGDFFSFAERSAHVDDCGLMFFGPRLPSRYSLLLLRKPFRFWKGIPCCHSRVRLGAEKDREKCAIRAHEISLSSTFCGLKQKLDIAVQMLDASGGDLCVAPGLGQYEGSLQNGLRVQREALGRPLRAFPVKLHRFRDIGIDFHRMAADAGIAGIADRGV